MRQLRYRVSLRVYDMWEEQLESGRRGGKLAQCYYPVVQVRYQLESSTVSELIVAWSLRYGVS